MKKLLTAILHLALTTACFSATYLEYDQNRKVDYMLDNHHTRVEYHHFIKNTGQPSLSYDYGVPVPSGTVNGTNDANILNAWSIQSNSTVTITVSDQATIHGFRCKELAELVSRGPVILANMIRAYPDTVAGVISNAVLSGSKIVSISSIVSGDYASLSNACTFAAMSNVVLVCATPDSTASLDTSIDYPSSWAALLPNIIPVSTVDRNGNLWIGWYGSNVVCTAGQYIVAYGVYSSGTSYAAPILSGSLALLMSRFPGQTAAAYRNAVFASSDRVGQVRRLDAVSLLSSPVPKLNIHGMCLEVSGLPGWSYVMEHSTDMVTWTSVASVTNGYMTPIPEGFSRLIVAPL